MCQLLHLEGCTLQATNHADEFILLRAAGAEQIDLPALGQSILLHEFPFVEEVIATEIEICLKLNSSYRSESLVALQQINFPPQDDASSNASEAYQAPIYFSSDTEDWQVVCEQTGLAREPYIEQLLACRFRVAMFGFLPGFVYLRGLPRRLHVPRKQTPTLRTRANAFAIGGTYAGIYSLPSPAGWHVVGSLGVNLIRHSQLPPLALQPGDELTLARIDKTEYERLTQGNVSLAEYHGRADHH